MATVRSSEISACMRNMLAIEVVMMMAWGVMEAGGGGMGSWRERKEAGSMSAVIQPMSIVTGSKYVNTIAG